ncbi:tyrosine-protein phosphatase [Ramlibacter henchirensis]|uniref:protein-tyrosine-phosphatase n=1 Tax=Ramlibacter henchirensis TaxID=204072 RepID=A0A4Z0BW63_9BURK|nr:tyrosine-protein phosphatase [Ramlibacter henchirensis]TFZ02724.1 tyrosine-protein phosphatase [Ramlibacter henchirensis]
MAGPDRLAAMLHGAPNFRDLGGLPTHDGRTVRPGCLLRSGQLGDLHAGDIELLHARVGRDVCVIDLRGAGERAGKPACALPGATVHSLPIEPTVARKLDALAAAGMSLEVEAARRFMREAYEGFARNAHAQLAMLFEHVLSRAGRPLLVHCAHGKDRTGFMVAMLLSALGVQRAAIMEDYLLTNQRVVPRASGRYPAGILHVLGSVRAEYLQAAFDAIDAQGGVDAYLERAGGLTPPRRERLRQALLTP